MRRGFAVLAACLAALPPARAQLALGTLEGRVEDAAGRPATVPIEVDGLLGARLALDSTGGRFRAALPYGAYTVRAASIAAECRVRIRPLATARCDLRPGESQTVDVGVAMTGGALDAAQGLLFQAPAVFSYPLDFTGAGEIRLPLVSFGAASWTATGFRLNGLDVADSYQPGRPLMFDDAAAADSLVTPKADADAVGVYLRGAESGWHGGLATGDTGAVFATGGRPDEFSWFTRDTAELSGPLGRRADFAATATGQWASQTPESAGSPAIRSRMLFANTRGRVRLGERDQVDALYSGSRLDLSSGGWPAGMEAILANRAMPSFYGVEGFANLREVDHMDLVQTGWTHLFAGGAGALEVRYGYSTAHLDTLPATAQNAPAQIDLLDPLPAAEAPLSNFAVRTRHQFAVAYQAGERRLAGMTHRLAAGGNGETSQPRNRFDATGGEDAITVDGQAALTVRLNTPVDTRVRVDSLAPYVSDTIGWTHGVSMQAMLVADAARGGPIRWTSPSPRVGIALPLPGFPRVTLRGNYARTYDVLAGRLLDFGDPQSLSGQVFDAGTEQLLQRFGGAYSSIAANLARPYADRFHVSAEAALPFAGRLGIDLVRSDEKDRIAAVDVGVPASDYSPVTILDPGPDFIPGTFDDQNLTVYAQNPATLGQDRYLLTNPAGLRELTETVTATAATDHRYADLRVSFTAEKSFGPTNPGSSAWVNDPGIVGALYGDPNSLIHATGHPFVDRAFVGKFQEVTEMPRWLGGVRLIHIVDYMDGLPFARELLVTGLPQGPFLVDTTLRGSPEGGNRAEYVLNWNLRAAREFRTPAGRFEATADLLNVLDNGNKIVESDLSGPQFNQRPALALPPPRTLRLGLRWQF